MAILKKVTDLFSSPWTAANNFLYGSTPTIKSAANQIGMNQASYPSLPTGPTAPTQGPVGPTPAQIQQAINLPAYVPPAGTGPKPSYMTSVGGSVTQQAGKVVPTPAPGGGGGVQPDPNGQYYADLNDLFAAGDMSGALSQLNVPDLQLGSIYNQLMQQLGPVPNLPTINVNDVANRRIASVYDPQYAAIDQAIRGLQDQYNFGVNQENSYGANADTALKNTYDALAAQLGAANQRTAGEYDQNAQAQGAAFDQAAQAMQALNDRVTARLGQQAGAAGQQNDPQSYIGRIMESYAGNQAADTQQKANVLQNIAAQRAAAQQYGESQVNQANKTGAQARADVATDVQSQLANLLMSLNQGTNQYNQQRTQLDLQKPRDLQDMIDQLNAQQYQQQEAARQARLAEMNTLGNLDINQQKNQVAARGQSVDLAKAKASIAAEQAKSRQSAVATAQANKPNTGMNAAKVANLNADTNLKNQKAAQVGVPQPTMQQLGTEAFQKFLSTAQDGYWGPLGAGPRFTAAINGIIDAVARSTDAKTLTGAVNPQFDPYQTASNLLATLANAKNQSMKVGANQGVGTANIDIHNLNMDALRKAIQYKYTGRAG